MARNLSKDYINLLMTGAWRKTGRHIKEDGKIVLTSWICTPPYRLLSRNIYTMAG